MRTSAAHPSHGFGLRTGLNGGNHLKGFSFTARHKIEAFQRPAVPPEAEYVKVRITKAGITDSDIALYLGEDGSGYPIIGGRQAAGVISEIAEDNIYCLKKGDRVLINPYLPCRECIQCKTNRASECQNMKIMGVNTDGFFRDFINVPIQNVMPLPEQVKDHEALFTEYISLALEVLDVLNMEKGDHVAIVGGDILGNILAQLIMYYQAIPILIDSNEQNLETARKSGIYFTIRDDSDVRGQLNQITGGRLAKYVIYVSGAKRSFRNTLEFAAVGGTIAIAGFMDSSMKVDLSMALRRRLSIVSINNGYREMRSALNIVATRTVNLEPLSAVTGKFAEIPAIIEKHADEFSSDEMFQVIIDTMSE